MTIYTISIKINGKVDQTKKNGFYKMATSFERKMRRRMEKYRWEIFLSILLFALGLVLSFLGLGFYLKLRQLYFPEGSISLFYFLSKIFTFALIIKGLMIAGFSVDRINLIRFIHGLLEKQKENKS